MVHSYGATFQNPEHSKSDLQNVCFLMFLEFKFWIQDAYLNHVYLLYKLFYFGKDFFFGDFLGLNFKIFFEKSLTNSYDFN